MARWTITDDDGRVMTIEVPDDSLIVSLDASDTRFRTTHTGVAQDVRQKLGFAIGQLRIKGRDD